VTATDTSVLYAGAARRAINPPLGTRQTGFRLFGNPVQAIESDLTATALVLSDGETEVVLIAIDLSVIGIDLSMWGQRPGDAVRAEVAGALGIPVVHVLLNTSHTHSGVATPEYMPDSDEQIALKERYKSDLTRLVVEAAVEARRSLRPARLGTGWGESGIGVYRRESRDGRDVLGEVPEHPIDRSVGVIRVDDLDGEPIATVFRFSAHPVTMGPRSMVVSSDFAGPARGVVESCLGGLALFLQGCAGNINPAVGIGYEVDCRDAKNRVGLELGGEVLRVAAGIRTNRRRGERRPLGTVPNILFTPWEPVGGDTCTYLGMAEEHVALDYVELPTPERAQAIRDHWQQLVEERRSPGRRSGRCVSRRSTSSGLTCWSRQSSRSGRRATSSSTRCGSTTSSSSGRTRSCSSRRVSRSGPGRRSPTPSCSASRTARSATCRGRRTTPRAAGTSTRPTPCPT
jgi:hypothetical protein